MTAPLRLTDRKREAIVAAAIAEFRANGFEVTSMDKIAATIHSPERAQDMVNRLSKREEGFTQWVRAAQEDGRLNCSDPAFAAHQIQSLLKAFAFWPQITLGQPTLDAANQASVIESAIDLFLAGYEVTAPRQT